MLRLDERRWAASMERKRDREKEMNRGRGPRSGAGRGEGEREGDEDGWFGDFLQGYFGHKKKIWKLAVALIAL